MKTAKNETKILVFTSLAHFLFHYYAMLFPALAIPLMLSLKLDLADVFKLGFFMYLLMGIGSLPAGYLSDRFGKKNSIIVFFLGSSISLILAALTHNRAAFILFLGMTGLFSSICHPAVMGLISVGIKNIGTALGINGVSGAIGLTSAPFIGALLNWIGGWRFAFIVSGIVGLLSGIMMIISKVEERSIREISITKTDNTSKNNRIKQFIILSIIMTLGGLAYRANSLVLPSYIEIHADFLSGLLGSFSSGLSAANIMAASVLVSIAYIFGMAGALFGGKLADRYELKRLYLIFYFIVFPTSLLMASASGFSFVMLASVYLFFTLGTQPIENSLVAKYTPEKWRSTAYGIKFILVFGIGSTAVYIVGWIKKAYSLAAVYNAIAIVMISISILIVILIAVAKTEESRLKNRLAATGNLHRSL